MRFIELSNHTLEEAFNTSVQLVFVTVSWGIDREKEKEKALKAWKRTH